MTVMGYGVILSLYGVLIATGLFFISSCLFNHESVTVRSAILRICKYLATEPVSLGLAVLMCCVHVGVEVAGVREYAMSEYGLPNGNIWAYVAYSFVHADIFHLVGNTGLLLVCGGLVERKISNIGLLALVVLCVPVGGFLATLTAPVFIDAPWENGDSSVGFSLVGNTIFLLCGFLVVECIFEGTRLRESLRKIPRLLNAWRSPGRLNPLQWPPKCNQIATFAIFLVWFLAGIREGTAESILGHSVGLALGLAAIIVYWAWRWLRRQRTTAVPLSERNHEAHAGHFQE